MRHRNAFSMTEVLIVAAIIGILVGMLLPAIQQARELSREVQCRNNLRQIGIAAYLFHETFERLPGGGLYAQILEYLEKPEWETAHWPPRPEDAVPFYLCPSRRGPEVGAKVDYAMTMGLPGQCVNPIDGSTLDPGRCRPLIDGSGVQASKNIIPQIVDGTANTLLLAHKGLDPEFYASPCGNPSWVRTTNPTMSDFYARRRDSYYWGADAVHTTRRPQFWSLLRDRSGGYRDAVIEHVYWYVGNAPCTLFMTSPHNRGMPCLFADGAVRKIGYTSPPSTEVQGSGPALRWRPSLESFVILSLWIPDDGLGLEGEVVE